ncbi:MAG: membrane-associated sensor domain-containing protein, partial [Betaproteobacteria bacterium]|nr:membrane-associated sensor domain-containing protein [Betaproteobacteria bacterium]
MEETVPSGLESAGTGVADDPAAGASEGEAVYAERVRHLYRLSRAGYFGTAINGAIVTFTLWDIVDNAVLTGWFAVALAVTLGRYLLYRAYQSAPGAHSAAESWANRFLAGAVVMGCMWGVLGTALFPAASIPHQFLVIFVIGGMCMSAAVALAPVKRVFYGFTLPALVPLIVMLFLQTNTLQIVMGAIAVVFTIVISAFAVEIRDHLAAAIDIKFENAGLVSRLSSAHRQVQESNRLLANRVESQERVEQELRQASQKFQALINASPLPIVVRDANGLIERWNPAAERMFGWSEAEALGRMVLWYPAGREQEGDRHRNMILRGETVSDVEAVRLRKDGAPLTVSLSGAP